MLQRQGVEKMKDFYTVVETVQNQSCLKKSTLKVVIFQNVTLQHL